MSPEADFMEDLRLGCGEMPRNRAAKPMLTALSVFASLLIHISAVACGMIIAAHGAAPPVPLPPGELIQVELVGLHAAGSGASPGTSAPFPKNAESPSSPVEAAKQTVETKTSPPNTAKKRKPAESARDESKQRAEHAARADTAHGAASSTDGNGAQAASNYGDGASPLGASGNPRPEYPELARQRGQEGKAVLLVDVNIQGNPVEIQLLKSSGYALLDKAAITTVWRWKFTPARRGGASVPGQVLLPVEFYLR